MPRSESYSPNTFPVQQDPSVAIVFISNWRTEPGVEEERSYPVCLSRGLSPFL